MGRADVKIPIVGEDKFSKTFDKALGGLGKIDQAAATLGTGLGVLGAAAAAGASAIFAVGLQAINSADHLGKLSDRLGASTEALSQYEYVAKLSGVRSETLVMGWQRMTRRVSEAARGYGEARGALKELNLEAGRLSRLAPEDQFEEIADALSKVENPADRVRLAMKLFDSEGVSLLQMMKGGAAGLREMRKEANSLGLTLSGEMAESAAEAKSALTKLEAAANAAKLKLGVMVGPEIVKSIDWIVGALEKIDELKKDATQEGSYGFWKSEQETKQYLEDMGLATAATLGFADSLNGIPKYDDFFQFGEGLPDFDSTPLKDMSFPEEWEHERIMQVSEDVGVLVDWWASVAIELDAVNEAALKSGVSLGGVSDTADAVGLVIGDAGETGAYRMADAIANAAAQGKLSLLDLGSIAQSVFGEVFSGFLRMGINSLFNPLAPITGVLGSGPTVFGIPGLPDPGKSSNGPVVNGNKSPITVESFNVHLTGDFIDDPIELRRVADVLYTELQAVASQHGPMD